MPQFSLNTPAARIGLIKGAILRHAEPKEVLGITGQNESMGKNMGDTMIFRRYLPFGGATTNSTTINQWSVDVAAHALQEGVTPNSDTLTPQDITVVLQQFGCLYMFTDKVADLYEDNIPDEMKKQTGQRMGLVREMIRYGVLKGATNKFYAGGTSRATVDEKIGLNIIRRVVKALEANRSTMITKVLAPGPAFNSNFVEDGYLVFVHTDAEPDIRDLPGFKEAASYANKKVVHPRELGSCERFRFITSPELAPYADSGAAIAGTTLFSTTGTSADVYPFIVVAEDAWGDVTLKGKGAFEPTHIAPGQKDKNDPHGQRGYIGSKFYSAAVICNQGWMAVIEAGVSALA